MFKNIGRIATEMYLLFQHHTTTEMMRNVSTDDDVFTITGTGWHFVKYLGPAMAVVGPDCRSERTQARVMAGPTYQGIFPKVATLPPSVQHVIWMVSVPIVYPRLDAVESLANTVAAGKKAVNTTYNILGKVTSSVAGVVGGKEMVSQGFSQVKKAVGKTGLMGNVLNQFGELDIQEVLKDMWTHDTKDLERTYFIRTLQGIAQQKGIRMTFLSGGEYFLKKRVLGNSSQSKLTGNRCRSVWCGLGPRSNTPGRSQDDVPGYLVADCQCSTGWLHLETSTQPKDALCPQEWTKINTRGFGHQGRYDGDIPHGRKRRNSRDEEINGP